MNVIANQFKLFSNCSEAVQQLFRSVSLKLGTLENLFWDPIN
jgi:hypothetical protein